MIDTRLRRAVDPPLNALARLLIRTGLTANQVTVAGFVIGLLAVPLLALELYGWALAVILVNRVLDGLDGSMARMTVVTDRGGYLDIVLDFIFYAAIPFGFILGQPDAAIPGAFLIFSFVGSGSSFLGFAVFAAKRRISTNLPSAKSIYYLGGLTEGFETMVAFALMCLLPKWFWLIALIFGILCWITAISRVSFAYNSLAPGTGGHHGPG